MVVSIQLKLMYSKLFYIFTIAEFTRKCHFLARFKERDQQTMRNRIYYSRRIFASQEMRRKCCDKIHWIFHSLQERQNISLLTMLVQLHVSMFFLGTFYWHRQMLSPPQNEQRVIWRNVSVALVTTQRQILLSYRNQAVDLIWETND